MSPNTTVLPTGATHHLLPGGWQAQAADGLTAPWMLHGPPGVGKSQVGQQLANEIGARLFDVRLTTIEPQNLRGLPYDDHAARKTVWFGRTVWHAASVARTMGHAATSNGRAPSVECLNRSDDQFI